MIFHNVHYTKAVFLIVFLCAINMMYGCSSRERYYDYKEVKQAMSTTAISNETMSKNDAFKYIQAHAQEYLGNDPDTYQADLKFKPTGVSYRSLEMDVLPYRYLYLCVRRYRIDNSSVNQIIDLYVNYPNPASRKLVSSGGFINQKEKAFKFVNAFMKLGVTFVD